jgi:hypothetical protein
MSRKRAHAESAKRLFAGCRSQEGFRDRREADVLAVDAKGRQTPAVIGAIPAAFEAAGSIAEGVKEALRRPELDLSGRTGI